MLVMKRKKCLNCKYEYPTDADSFWTENSNLKVGFLAYFFLL